MFSILTGSFCVNYYVDPLNIFGNKYVDIIYRQNERELKSIYLQKNKKKFNTVIIGSSRTSYIPVSSYGNLTIFNYSMSGICIEEYIEYLNFFAETQGEPSVIFLSFDFHTSNNNYGKPADSRKIIDFTKSKIKPIFYYFTLNTLKNSLDVILQSRDDLTEYYNRDIIKHRVNTNIPLTDESIKNTLDEYTYNYLKRYEYREDYKKFLLTIRNRFPHSRIIVIICPVHDSLFNWTIQMISDKHYGRWINDIKDIFDEIYDFSGRESITTNRMNFFDAAHFYPSVGDKIMTEIFQEMYKPKSADNA